MLAHELVNNVHAFAEEPAFAFTALLGGNSQELAEPRRVPGAFGDRFRLRGTRFECGLVNILVDNGLLLLGALAVYRSVLRTVKTAERAIATGTAVFALFGFPAGAERLATTTAIVVTTATAFSQYVGDLEKATPVVNNLDLFYKD